MNGFNVCVKILGTITHTLLVQLKQQQQQQQRNNNNLTLGCIALQFSELRVPLLHIQAVLVPVSFIDRGEHYPCDDLAPSSIWVHICTEMLLVDIQWQIHNSSTQTARAFRPRLSALNVSNSGGHVQWRGQSANQHVRYKRRGGCQ